MFTPPFTFLSISTWVNVRMVVTFLVKSQNIPCRLLNITGMGLFADITARESGLAAVVNFKKPTLRLAQCDG